MSDTLTLHDVTRALARHWGKVLVVMLLTVAAVSTATYLIKDRFEATSLVLIKFGREFAVRTDPGSSQVVRPEREALINAELSILRSNNVLEAVVNEVGVRELYPALTPPPDGTLMRAAVKKFDADFKVSGVRDSDVIRVSFRHTDPELAARAVNAAIGHFKAQHLKAFGDPAATAFLEQKVDALREELEASELRLKAFQETSRTALIGADRREMLGDQAALIERSLTDTLNEIAGLTQTLEFLRQQQQRSTEDTALLRASQNTRIIDESKARLLELQLRERELLGTYHPTNRQVVGVREQLDLVKDFLLEQEAIASKGGLYQQLETKIINSTADLRFQEGKAETLRRQLGQVHRELRALPEQEVRYRALLRERDEQENNFRTYLRKVEEARISEEMDRQNIANISVIQEAFVPVDAVWPPRRLNAAAGLVLGLLLGLAFAFFLEYGQQILKDPKDAAARLDLPVLATVEHRSSDHRLRRVS